LTLLGTYEAWPQRVFGQTSTAEAADRFQVDGSTITRIRAIRALAVQG
jgi:hypothetical protein